MSLITELWEEEAAFLKGEADMILPFSLTYFPGEKEDKKVALEIYPMFRAVGDNILKKFAAEPLRTFSEEGISLIKSSIGAAIPELGFTLGEEADDYFICRRILPCNASTKAIPIKSTEGLENLTDYDIDTMTEYGHIFCGIVEDGKILSVACTNSPILEGEPGAVEIGVETADGYGGKGYGRASVTALTNMLSEMGYEVRYEYASKNRPSEALVNSLETELFSVTYYLLGIKN